MVLLEAKILVERPEAVAPRASVMRFVETPDLLVETSRAQPNGVHKERQQAPQRWLRSDRIPYQTAEFRRLNFHFELSRSHRE